MRRQQTLPLAILFAVACSTAYGQTMSGDFDGSGQVATGDFNLVLSNWAASVPPVPAGFIEVPTAPQVDNDELNALIGGWGGGGEPPNEDIRHAARVQYTPADLVGSGYIANDIFIDFPGQLGGQQLSIQFTSSSFFNHTFGTDFEPSSEFISLFPELAFDSFVTTGVPFGPQADARTAKVGGAANIPAALPFWSMDGQAISATWIRAMDHPVFNQSDFMVARITLSPDAAGSGSFLSSTVEGLEWMRSFEVVGGQILFAPSNVPGDFNDDGVVDLADYSFWRNHLGAPPGTLTNDSSGLAVGSTQYEMWKAHFGATVPELEVLAAAQVPEPVALVAALLLSGICLSLHRRRPNA